MLDHETFERLLAEAVLAPSSHNTQPWLFENAATGVRLHADRTRALPVNDPEDRELTISCGAALLTLRVAAAGVGLGTTVELLPDSKAPDLLAEVSFGGPADPELALLVPAIAARRTYRKRFAAVPVPEQVQQSLLQAAGVESAILDFLASDEQRYAAAALVAEGDVEQWHDVRWRRELAAWMHPRRSGDGLTLPWLAVPVAQVVVRSFDMGDGVAAKDRELAEHSPVLAVLATGGDGPADWLRAGQALQRVLLAATGAGLQASYLNQPIQIARLRPLLAELVGGGVHPQIFLRLGIPEESLPPSRRRAPAEVLGP